MTIDTVPAGKPAGLERKWKVLIAVMFGIFMIILDSTIVNIAFPTLRLQFGASLTDAQPAIFFAAGLRSKRDSFYWVCRPPRPLPLRIFT